MWNWMCHGMIPQSYKNRFFVLLDTQNKCSSVDLSKVPRFIDTTNALEVYNTGNIVSMLQHHENDVEFNYEQPQLYWTFFDKRIYIYDNSILFKGFVTTLKNNVYEVSQFEFLFKRYSKRSCSTFYA